MIRYGKLLKKIRKQKKLRQIDLSKAIGIPAHSYSAIERGELLPDSPNVLKLLNSSIYTSTETKKLKKVYELSKKNFYRKRREQKEKKELEKFKIQQEKIKRKRRKEERLIRNKPNFYKKLNSLGDLSKVDVNDPKLQDIRESVSGKRYWEGENY